MQVSETVSRKKNSFRLTKNGAGLYVIVDDQYYNFRPRFEVFKYFKLKKATVPLDSFTNMIPSSFPGFLVALHEDGYYGYIARMRYEDRNLVIKYADLGKIETIKVVRNKYGYPVKVKVYFKNGKSLSLVRGGMARKYPEIIDKPTTYRNLEYLNYNRKVSERFISELRRKFLPECDFRPLYKYLLKVVRTGRIGSRPFERVPNWIAVYLLPHLPFIKEYLSEDFENTKTFILAYSVLAIRHSYLTDKGRKGIFARFDKATIEKLTDLAEFLRTRCYFKHKKSFIQALAYYTLKGIEAEDIPLTNPSFFSETSKKLKELHNSLIVGVNYPEAYSKLLRLGKEVAQSIQFLEDIDTVLSPENIDILRSITVYTNARILNLDVDSFSESPFVISIRLRRMPDYLGVSFLNTTTDSKRARTKRNKLIRGYIYYPAPIEYLIFIKVNVNGSRIQSLSYVVEVVETRTSVNRILNKMGPDILRTTNPLHKLFPLNIPAYKGRPIDRKPNQTPHLYPLRAEILWKVREVPVNAKQEVQKRVLGYKIFLRGTLCLGRLGHLYISSDANPAEEAEIHSINFDNFLANFSLDNSEGYISPLQIRFPLKEYLY
ncbi:MAG: hypothetical protein QXS68_06775 [Candidatus Methanomethylicaceae archaeon]